MVAEGVTATEPEAGTEPIAGAMETEVEPEVLQARALDWPLRIGDGEAVKLEMVGTSVTVTVACAVTVPAALVAVRV